MIRFVLVMIFAVSSSLALTTTYHFRGPKYTTSVVKATNPPSPTQPSDMVIMISNFCSGPYALGSVSVTNGTFAVSPPALIQSQFTGDFKYGFELQANKNEDINALVVYSQSSQPAGVLQVQVFSQPNVWGLTVSYETVLGVFITQADVGVLSVYDVVVGKNVTC